VELLLQVTFCVAVGALVASMPSTGIKQISCLQLITCLYKLLIKVVYLVTLIQYALHCALYTSFDHLGTCLCITICARQFVRCRP
jgi:type III secretory pathway component EscU